MSAPKDGGTVSAWLFSIGSLLALLLPLRVYAGNTTCASGQLDWYTSVVGESPCVTYQRLRQICNSDYEVPDFRPRTPGDNCDDQVSACCCNTVAFQLSMLCMNCQQDHLAGDQIGIDAGVGAYTLYRATCGAGTNHSLPSDIQDAVCNKNIRLDDFLYGGWADGSWFYVWTRENAERTHAAKNNNTFTHCKNQISPSVVPPPKPTPSTSTSTSTSEHVTTTPNSPAIPTTTSNATPPTSISTESSASTTSSISNTAGASASSAPLHDPVAVPNTQTGASSPPVTSGSVSSSSTAESPSSSAATSDTSGAVETHSSNLGAIIGGVVGGVALLAGIVGIFVWLRRARARGSGGLARRLRKVTRTDTPRQNSGHASGVDLFSGDGTSNTHVTAQSPGYVSLPTSFPRSAWSDYSSVLPRSSAPTGRDVRRSTDAGVLIPLSRSESGRLPPAYRSWVVDSTVLSEGTEPTTGSEESMRNGTSEAEGDSRVPLVPLRFDEK